MVIMFATQCEHSSRPSTDVIAMCFYRLRRAAMASLSAIEIQRIYRGWKGRQFAAFARHVTKATIGLQSAFRVRHVIG